MINFEKYIFIIITYIFIFFEKTRLNNNLSHPYLKYLSLVFIFWWESSILLVNFSDKGQCYQLQSPCFTLDPHKLIHLNSWKLFSFASLFPSSASAITLLLFFSQFDFYCSDSTVLISAVVFVFLIFMLSKSINVVTNGRISLFFFFFQCYSQVLYILSTN